MYLNRLKQMVKNKSRLEGSICEAYFSQETSHFCIYYFESHVQTMRNRVSHNDGAGLHETTDPNMSIFKFSSREAGSGKS